MLVAMSLGCHSLADADRERVFDALNVHAHAAYEAMRDVAPREPESSSTFDEDVAPGVHLDASVFSEEYPAGPPSFSAHAEGTLTLTGADDAGLVLDGEVAAILDHYDVVLSHVLRVEIHVDGEVEASGALEANVPFDYTWAVSLEEESYYTWSGAGEVDGVDVATFGETPLPDADWSDPCSEPLPEVVIEAVDFSCEGDLATNLTLSNVPIDRLCTYFLPGADQPATSCSALFEHPLGSCTHSGGSCLLDGYPTVRIEAWSDGDEIVGESEGGGHELVDCVIVGPDPAAFGCGCRTLATFDDLDPADCERPAE